MLELIRLVNLVFLILNLLIIVRILLSWIPGVSFGHPVVRIVHQLTSPILDPIRRVLPPVGGMDLSPIVAVLLLSLIQQLLNEVMSAL